MSQLIPIAIKFAKGVSASKTLTQAVKIAAITKGATEVAKAAAPKPPAVPTKISQTPTVIFAGEQAKKYEGDSQMDLLSTIIAGRERKNKLG
jgi:hypothetical protein